MSISLFKHNEEAYELALSMLGEKGRAAVIHPTGTGKSFIGFKICEDHPDKTVCWLSPSEYIFKTQLENLVKTTGGYQPDNIRFFTYAKLINLSRAELVEICPDYIILDEFHRCGAQIWGQGVQKLLSIYPNVPVLGLSATNIRYLDNQRDMADELFDGNVASEMTLGDANVRGILNPPKYVLSVFSYQKDLAQYQSRIRHAKNKAVREEAEQYLEALRRALDKAEGLDTVFAKHMANREGKYIVFCAGYAHLCEMMKKVPDWFSKVDAHPHVYSAYSDDPETSKAFDGFKHDDSNHLKLLFCIDMLNEGIHVEDISGVILLRPTVSPIIYKQQIGRALSAGGKNHAVIFDIVLNIENLYSIGAIEEEMQIAMTYYRSHGETDEIVNEHFDVVDEVRDCRILFDKLRDTLAASWDLMYEKAASYYREHGNLEIPKRYKTEDGYSLGNWILTQRKVRDGEQYGKLSVEQIQRLDAIGMVWGSYRDFSWERNFSAAKAYYEEFGNLSVAVSYVDENGVRLGSWISGLRTARKSGNQRGYLTEKRIGALDAIGMIWDVPDYLWQRYYSACMDYHRAHGDLDVPSDYVAADGTRLGIWIGNIRAAYHGTNPNYHLTEEQIQALDQLGMLWSKRYDRQWEIGYKEALHYRKQCGNLDVPATYQSESGYALGRWISRQRGNTKLPDCRRKMLDDLGMIWQKPDSWEVRFALAKKYFEEHGDLNVSAQYIVDGIWLNKWLNEQRQIYSGNRGKKRLTPDQIERLEAIGMTWENRNDAIRCEAWKKQFENARAFYTENGHLNVPDNYVSSDGKKLKVWILKQRRRYRQGTLSEEQMAALASIGMVWRQNHSEELVLNGRSVMKNKVEGDQARLI